MYNVLMTKKESCVRVVSVLQSSVWGSITSGRINLVMFFMHGYDTRNSKQFIYHIQIINKYQKQNNTRVVGGDILI